MAVGLLGTVFLQHLAYVFLTKSFFALKFKEIIISYYPAVIASILIFISISLIGFIMDKINIGLLINFVLRLISGIIIILVLLKFSFTNNIKEIINERIIKNFGGSIAIKVIKWLRIF